MELQFLRSLTRYLLENKIEWMKIIVRAPNWIGDSVLALPAVRSLSKNFPEAQIWIAAKHWVKDLFQSQDFIKGIIPLPAADDIKSMRNSAKIMKAFDFDTGVLLANSFGSALLFYLAKIPHRWGYSRDGRGFLLTRKISLKRSKNSLHQADYYMALISGLGLKIHSPKLFLPLTPEEKEDARKLLFSHGLELKRPLVILNPGASYGPAKRWPAKNYAELGRLLQDRDKASILITGSADEDELAHSIASLMTTKPLVLTGQTDLRRLAGLISQSKLFVTNDSGPMHMANALGVPVIAIFGPTDPGTTGPFQDPAVVIKKDAVCWPCSYRDCPFDHRCMTAIAPEEILAACQRFLS